MFHEDQEQNLRKKRKEQEKKKKKKKVYFESGLILQSDINRNLTFHPSFLRLLPSLLLVHAAESILGRETQRSS